MSTKTYNISETVQDRTNVTMTDYNRKSHTRFRFVPKSMTLDDLERPKHTFAEKSFYGAHQNILNEGNPYYQYQRQNVGQ